MRPKGALVLKTIGILMIVYGSVTLLAYAATLALFPVITSDSSTVGMLEQYGMTVDNVFAKLWQAVIVSVLITGCGVLSIIGSKQKERLYLAIIGAGISWILCVATLVISFLTATQIGAIDFVINITIPILITLGVVLNLVSFRSDKKRKPIEQSD